MTMDLYKLGDVMFNHDNTSATIYKYNSHYLYFVNLHNGYNEVKFTIYN